MAKQAIAAEAPILIGLNRLQSLKLYAILALS